MQGGLNKKQLLEMLNMQSAMNTRVNSAWPSAKYPFLRAVAVECGEALDHHGWKWWKTQEKDIDQLRMELVDIWHFLLSAFLVWADGNATMASVDVLESLKSDEEIEFDGRTYYPAGLYLIEKIELMMGLATTRRASIGLFDAMLTDCGMTWSDLYAQYVGKNTLNFFRQDHGYNAKPSAYQKIWAGREDNEHLVEVMAELEGSRSDYAAELYRRLEARYAELGLVNA